MEKARTQALANRDQAVKSEAEKYAKPEYDAARKRAGEVAVATAKEVMERAKNQATASRDQAARSEADRLAKDLFDAARAKESQADTLANRQAYAEATP